MRRVTDFRVPVDAVLSAFGLEGTVTPKDGAAIEGVSVVWEPVLSEDVPGGMTAHRRESIKRLAVARTEVPLLPRGSFIEAPEVEGGTVKRWRVDAPDSIDPEWIHVIVVEVPAGG